MNLRFRTKCMVGGSRFCVKVERDIVLYSLLKKTKKQEG